MNKIEQKIQSKDTFENMNIINSNLSNIYERNIIKPEFKSIETIITCSILMKFPYDNEFTEYQCFYEKYNYKNNNKVI
jgi:hypothetical protein